MREDGGCCELNFGTKTGERSQRGEDQSELQLKQKLFFTNLVSHLGAETQQNDEVTFYQASSSCEEDTPPTYIRQWAGLLSTDGICWLMSS